MLFPEPQPFAEAARSHAVRALLPTTLSSAELDRLGAEILARAMFSARTTNAGYLQLVQDQVGALLAGDTDAATVRLTLQAALDRLDYVAGSADEEGTITDLRSDQRLNLLVSTNLQQAQGYGAYAQGQDPAILDQYPAQELYRAEGRRVPRDWPARWQEAGGEFYGNGQSMIALKDADIWTAISAFGNPYPPFDFGSGMDVRDVDRDTAIALGLIDRDTQVEPAPARDFAADAAASADGLDAALQEVLTREGYVLQGGVLTVANPEGGTARG